MEDFKKKNGADTNDKEIVFSKSVKAGKRIYYLDVKKNKKEELFLAITESKKVISGEGAASHVSFEKHKIFLYKEDFDKFLNGLEDTIAFINENQKSTTMHTQISDENNLEESELVFAESTQSGVLNSEIEIDIDFE